MGLGFTSPGYCPSHCLGYIVPAGGSIAPDVDSAQHPDAGVNAVSSSSMSWSVDRGTSRLLSSAVLA